MSGEGVPFNPALATALVSTAAERGDPEAQAEHGFRLALGIYPPHPGGTSGCLGIHPSEQVISRAGLRCIVSAAL